MVSVVVFDSCEISSDDSNYKHDRHDIHTGQRMHRMNMNCNDHFSSENEEKELSSVSTAHKYIILILKE